MFRDLHNHREGWARPDDPVRARTRTPDHTDLHRARLIRWGKVPGNDERAEAKEAIHSYLTAKMEQGLVRNRVDLLDAVKEAGLEINRQGKTLGEQQRTLTTYIQNLGQLQQAMGQDRADLQALMRRLEDLARLYKRLEPLLSRLNSVLNDG